MLNKLISIATGFCLLAMPVSACTTWISMPDANDLGKLILHKNRDFGKGRELPVTMKLTEAQEGSFRYIDICKYMYFNEKGLATVNNVVPKANDTNGQKTRDPSGIMRQLVKSCSTIPEVLEVLTKLQQDTYLSPTNLMMTDGDQAMIIEITSKHFATRPCLSGIMVHTNHFLLPQLDRFHEPTGQNTAKSTRRLGLTQELFHNLLNQNGKLRLQDFLTISRYHDDDHYPDQAPFRNSTVCAADYIVDTDYPTVLSTILIQPGPPVCTLAIPVPLCCQTLPKALSDGELGRLSYQLKKRGGIHHPFKETLQHLEQEFWQDYLETVDLAQILLADDLQAEAVYMLQTLLDTQTAKAVEQLKAIIKTLPPPPKPAEKPAEKSEEKPAEQPEKKSA